MNKSLSLDEIRL